MTTKEMMNAYVDTYYEVADYSKDWCEGCPVKAQCHTEELFWGCGIWEDEMGEDLQSSHKKNKKSLKQGLTNLSPCAILIIEVKERTKQKENTIMATTYKELLTKYANGANKDFALEEILKVITEEQADEIIRNILEKKVANRG